MRQITLDRVKKDNTNLREYSDTLWRALRKERFKKATPDVVSNELAYEEQAIRDAVHSDFDVDVEKFIKTYLKSREAAIFRLYLYGGKIRQSDIGDILNVSQSTVTNTLMGTPATERKPARKGVLRMFGEYYYADRMPEDPNDC